MFVETKGEIRIRESKRNRHHNTTPKRKKGQKGKQRSTKHYIENERSINTNPLQTGSKSGSLEG